MVSKNARQLARLVMAVLVVRVGACFAAEGGAAPANGQAIRGYAGLYDSLERFRSEAFPCVVLIDPTDPSALPGNVATPGGLWRLFTLRARITALSGLDCYCFHYTQLQRDTLQRPVVKAIVLRAPSPAGMLKCDSAREELWAMLRETTIPTIAFCGGFHQVYLAFGGACGDMRRLQPGEPDPHPGYAPGRMKEWGFCTIRPLRKDPLFEGLGDPFEMLEQHVSECRLLPAEFELLAGNEACRVQAIKHRTRPLYATQFHPEAYDEAHLDGRTLLLNFFRLAGAAGNIAR